MRIAGTPNEILKRFHYAKKTRSRMIYAMPGGHLFFLYDRGRYLYVKTTLEISHNVAITPASSQNIVRFLMRARKEEKIHFVRASVYEIQLNDRIELTTQMFTFLQPDALYSKSSKKLEALLATHKNQNLSTLRIQKKLLTDMSAQFFSATQQLGLSCRLGSRNKGTKIERPNILRVEDRELVFFRELTLRGRVSELGVRFTHGFALTKYAGSKVFELTDDTLAVVNSIDGIHEDDYVHLVNVGDDYLVEYHSNGLKMKYFVPSYKNIGNEKLL